MTPICDTLDRMIVMLEITIMSTDDPELAEQAKQYKSNLELLRNQLIRKVGK